MKHKRLQVFIEKAGINKQNPPHSLIYTQDFAVDIRLDAA
jgi:hypothetical protein